MIFTDTTVPLNDSLSLLTVILPFLLLLMIWSMIWKGFALWKAGGNKDKAWFIILFLVNTAGILEILYLFVFSKKETNNNIKICLSPAELEKSLIKDPEPTEPKL